MWGWKEKFIVWSSANSYYLWFGVKTWLSHSSRETFLCISRGTCQCSAMPPDITSFTISVINIDCSAVHVVGTTRIPGCVFSIPSSFLSPLVLKGKLRKMWIWCWVQILPWPFLQAKPNPALFFDHNHITSGVSVFQVKVNRKFSGSSCSDMVFSWAMSVPYNVCTLQCLYLTRFKSNPIICKTLNSFNLWHSEFIYR